MKTKTKILIAAIVAAVISLVVLCGVWEFSSAWVKAMFSIVFAISVLTAGLIACTYEGGQDDDF